MDDTITPRESLENDMPTPLFMFRQTEKVERDKDGVVYYEISEEDLQRLATETGVVLFKSEDSVVAEVLEEIVEQVSSLVDLEELVVANSEMEQYELQEDGADFNIGAGSGAMSFEMPYERKKRPPKAEGETFSFGRFICYWCDQRFRCYSHLKQHVQKHLTNNPIKCNICGKTFTQKGTLNTHMFIHTGERPHKCVQCDRAFITKTKLRQHLRTHTKEKPYSCNICNASFAVSWSLKVHMKVHMVGATGGKRGGSTLTAGDVKLMKCNKCPAQFSEKEDLKQHKKAAHPGDSEKKTTTIATPTENGVYQCELCQKTFEQKAYFRKHMRRHYRPKYQCSVCNKEFSEKESLKSHLGIHTGEQPFECQICNIKFAVASYLKRHMTVHVEEAKYECDICHSKYRSIGLLSRHKKIHLVEKPHKCSLCDSTFVSTSDLKRHTRTHTGEKPFACQYCGQRFTQTTSLRKHREKKHPVEIHQMNSENNMEAVQELIEWIDTQSHETV